MNEGIDPLNIKLVCGWKPSGHIYAPAGLPLLKEPRKKQTDVNQVKVLNDTITYKMQD